MIPVKRPVVRQTAEVDGRTGKPIVICLEQGGRNVSLWAKGDRTKYLVPIKSILVLGARIRSEQIKAKKLAERKARLAARKKGGG